MNKLLNNFLLGDLELANRVVMAPMTRSRAGLGDTPTSLNATYYAQRASAGLIITEATNITDNSCAFGKSTTPSESTAVRLPTHGRRVSTAWRCTPQTVTCRTSFLPQAPTSASTSTADQS